MQFLTKQGLRVSAYLDDILGANPLQHSANQDALIAAYLLNALGFFLSMGTPDKPKSILTPTQTLIHLGFKVDTHRWTLAIPDKKLQATLHLLKQAQKTATKNKPITIAQLASLIGTLQALMDAVPLARLYTRHLLRLKNQAKERNNWSDKIYYTPEALSEIT